MKRRLMRRHPQRGVSPGTLLDLADYAPGQRLLDLCGGDGAVSTEALRRGTPASSILLVDLHPQCSLPVVQVQADAHAMVPKLPRPHTLFDVIAIRQAAHHLFWDYSFVVMLRMLLKRKGCLVFDTYDHPFWQIRTGTRFWEASWCLGAKVWCLRASWEGLKLTTKRRWTESTLRTRLDVAFNVLVLKEGREIRWVCTPKE